MIDPQDDRFNELHDLLGDITAYGHRAGKVVHSIRQMGRKTKTIRENVSLNDVVRNVVHMVRPEAALHSCEVTTSLDLNLPMIDGDPVELQQVVINLVVNAIDLMRQISIQSRRVEIATKANGRGTVELSVRDFGLGIAEGAQDHLFDHFFTTKPDGLGMGLAIAQSIIQSHGGIISSENVENGGARFAFTVPTNGI